MKNEARREGTLAAMLSMEGTIDDAIPISKGVHFPSGPLLEEQGEPQTDSHPQKT